jgi:hypothetical protein
MFTDWNQLTDEAQIALSRAALHRAVAAIAAQAEVLAHEMECGELADHGGAEALRLFAAVVRVNDADELVPLGHA